MNYDNILSQPEIKEAIKELKAVCDLMKQNHDSGKPYDAETQQGLIIIKNLRLMGLNPEQIRSIYNLMK